MYESPALNPESANSDAASLVGKGAGIAARVTVDAASTGTDANSYSVSENRAYNHKEGHLTRNQEAKATNAAKAAEADIEKLRSYQIAAVLG